MVDYFHEKHIKRAHHQQNLCGLCHVCTQTVRRSAEDAHLELHAFEMTQQNYEWLAWAFQRFALNVTLVHAAVSNASGVVATPAAVRTGEEALTAESTRQVQKRYSDFIALDARLRATYGNRKLDMLLAKSRLPGACSRACSSA